MQTKLSDFVRKKLRENLAKESLHYIIDNQISALSNAEILEKCNHLETILKKSGLKFGHKVVLSGENSLEWIIIYITLILMEVIVVPLDSELPPTDFKKNIEFIEPDLIFIFSAQIYEFDGFLSAKMDFNNWTIYQKSDFNLTMREVDKHSSGYIATIVQSSASGGSSKSIQLTDQNLVDVILTYQNRVTTNYTNGFIFNILPLSAIYPCIICLTCLCNGLPFLTISTKNHSILEILSKERIYCMPSVPLLLEVIHKKIFETVNQQSFFKRTLFSSLLKLSQSIRRIFGFNIGRRLFREIHSKINVELFVSGGAPLALKISRDLCGLGFTIQEGYGLTETSGLVSHSDGSYIALGTVGKVVEGMQIKIVNCDQKGCGEILIKGRLMAGYFKNPEATRRNIEGGWFHTGDIGRLDARGNLIIVGRIKDIIVHSDEHKTIPQEIELHYVGIEGVQKLAVIGVRDVAHEYDRVHMAIVLDEKILQKFAGNKVEALKKVEQLVFQRGLSLPQYLKVYKLHLVDSIPISNLGKVKKNELISLLGLDQ